MKDYTLINNTHNDTAMRVIKQETEALEILAKNLPQDFANIVELIANLRGRLVISGMGKSGHIARKIAASLASTGTAALYIHPGEASHGDLGMITADDVVMLLSNSGETQELMDIIAYCKRFHIKLIGMMMKIDSTLAQVSDFVLNVPQIPEASTVDAPTTSALMMLALGDALTVATHEAKGFSKDDFKLYHPGGKIGASLSKVASLMHKATELPTITEDAEMSEAILTMTSKGFGCVVVLGDDEKIIGIITDGDLRRHMNSNLLQQKVKNIMHLKPKTIAAEMIASEALTIMEDNAITSLLVAKNNKLVGILHIHDLLRVGVK